MSVEGWKTKALGSVAEIIMGQSPDSRYYSEEEIGLPFLQGCAEFTSKFPSAVLFCSQVKKIARTGSILFSVRAPVGRTNLTDTDYIIGRGLAALIASQISQDYLHHYLVYSESGFRNNSQGSTFEAINSKELRDWAISFPEFLQEQTQIATILSTIDRAIEQTEALIAKQQRIKTGLMQDLLTKGIDENGNIRSEETHDFKDSPLGRIPVEWEVESCSAICKEIVVGIVIRPAQYYKPSGVPVLRSANVRENIIDTSDMVYMSERDNIALNKSRLSVGDLVTVRTGYPGNTAVITPELDGSNCVDIVISRPDSRRVRSNYLALWINSNFGKKQILEGQGGLAQQHFNVGEVRKLLVKVPRINEQIRIEDLLLLQGREVFKLQSQLQKLKLQKTGLMQDLLTGKVRVTDLLNQKAAVN
ncbi:restriction endonuclease subunit S [Microcystis aeruginosa CS-338/01]|uniref:restriction endonuclease subunit S n=1 Tax=Microcystis aeruginosa TaxID=1126 RepID=UPI002330EA9B|nr:restriction endonuclease subunit S [Microcystis aeruginosa]MDB9508008.1 restriction endonuclease subunit S [Microcystis aeruginosa CS-338/01]